MVEKKILPEKKVPIVTFSDLIEANIWDTNLEETFKNVSDVIKDKDWSVKKNEACTYITIRIDMRSGKHILKNRRGERIHISDVQKQKE